MILQTVVRMQNVLVRQNDIGQEDIKNAIQSMQPPVALRVGGAMQKKIMLEML
jgi:hypothetical protein